MLTLPSEIVGRINKVLLGVRTVPDSTHHTTNHTPHTTHHADHAAQRRALPRPAAAATPRHAPHEEFYMTLDRPSHRARRTTRGTAIDTSPARRASQSRHQATDIIRPSLHDGGVEWGAVVLVRPFVLPSPRVPYGSFVVSQAGGLACLTVSIYAGA